MQTPNQTLQQTERPPPRLPKGDSRGCVGDVKDNIQADGRRHVGFWEFEAHRGGCRC
jgi:hypothetical protein